MAVVSNGTTIIDNGAFDPAIPTGSLVLIKSITASSSASIEFINGTNGVVLDGTYTSYVFKFINIHPASDAQNLTFQGSINSGSSYGVTITSTVFLTYHGENDSTALEYSTGFDQAQGTGFQYISNDVGADSDQQVSGTLQLFNPSSTTYVKHFISRTQNAEANNSSEDNYTAGYFNTTSAINAIKFQFVSGNIDDGIIKLYGVK